MQVYISIILYYIISYIILYYISIILYYIIISYYIYILLNVAVLAQSRVHPSACEGICVHISIASPYGEGDQFKGGHREGDGKDENCQKVTEAGKKNDEDRHGVLEGGAGGGGGGGGG